MSFGELPTPTKTSTVTFDTAGGSNITNVKNDSSTPKNKIKLLADTTNKKTINYNFLGWYLEKNYTTKVEDATIVKTNENVDLYAKWEEVKKDTYLLTIEYHIGEDVKYDVISKRNGFMIYANDKYGVMDKFQNEYRLNIIDKYEKDKETYLEEKQNEIRSAVIFAGVILAISLIEIYLMIRSSFLSRIKEIGVLRAIGVKKRDIYRMFVGEIISITTIASVPRNSINVLHIKPSIKNTICRQNVHNKLCYSRA